LLFSVSKDHIFDEGRKTEELFNVVAKPIVENAVKGINGTIFAYGQTSSGKVTKKIADILVHKIKKLHSFSY
jgi:hypothetical protein